MYINFLNKNDQVYESNGIAYFIGNYVEFNNLTKIEFMSTWSTRSIITFVER